jgi:putative transcriptional regulator
VESVNPLDSDAPNLRGSLLLAHPSLRDPNFRRTILFLSMHDREDGAFGLILNRPTEHNLGEFLPYPDQGAAEEVPVYAGGPVGADELILVSFSWQEDEGQLTVRSHLSLEEFGGLTSVGGLLRAFRGYAGWGAGQLEAELSQQAWLVFPFTRDIFSASDIENLWYRMVSSLGPAYHLLAQAPDDPTMN